MKKEIRYIRRGHLILDDQTGDIKDCGSINAAKRESRRLPAGSVQTQSHKRPGIPSRQPFFGKAK